MDWEMKYKLVVGDKAKLNYTGERMKQAEDKVAHLAEEGRRVERSE